MNAELSTQLTELIREINTKGWSAATGTNYSFKDLSTGYWISMSGLDKSTFSATDFMHVDETGVPLPPFEALKPSAENLIHAFIYKKTEAQVILHSHSVYSTILSQSAIELKQNEIKIKNYEVQKAIEGITSHEEELIIPCFENNQDMLAFTEQLENRFESAIKASSFLIGNHGCYTWGKDLFTAKRHLEAIEFLLECEYKKRLLI